MAFDGSANITVSDATAVKLTGNQTIGGTKTFTSNIVGNITGNLSGNATSATNATKLATPRQINGVNFDGSGNITVVDSTKAPLASPALTGTPTAPTAAVATDNTQIATTAFVKSVVASSGSFTQSLTQNGWTKLPNGLIIQWSNYHQAKDTRVTKNFPIAFPSACFVVSVVLTDDIKYDVGNWGATAGGHVISTSQYNSSLGHYGGSGTVGEKLSMIAIGY